MDDDGHSVVELTQLEADMVVLAETARWQPGEIMRMKTSRRMLLAAVLQQRAADAYKPKEPPPGSGDKGEWVPPAQSNKGPKATRARSRAGKR